MYPESILKVADTGRILVSYKQGCRGGPLCPPKTEGIILDIGRDGEILSIEIIDVSKRLEKEVTQKIAQKYLAPA